MVTPFQILRAWEAGNFLKYRADTPILYLGKLSASQALETWAKTIISKKKNKKYILLLQEFESKVNCFLSLWVLHPREINSPLQFYLRCIFRKTFPGDDRVGKKAFIGTILILITQFYGFIICKLCRQYIWLPIQSLTTASNLPLVTSKFLILKIDWEKIIEYIVIRMKLLNLWFYPVIKFLVSSCDSMGFMLLQKSNDHKALITDHIHRYRTLEKDA